MDARPFRTGPGPAELAQTVLVHAPTLHVRLGDGVAEVVTVSGIDAAGSIVLLVDAHGMLAERVSFRTMPCTVHAALVSPGRGPDRALYPLAVLGTAQLVDDVEAALAAIADTHPERPIDVVLRPDASALLRVDVTALRLAGETVDPVEYAVAERDPLAEGSDDVIRRLICDHRSTVVQLAHLLDPALLGDVCVPAPVRVDRYGLTFQIDSTTGRALARLDFPAALRGPAELPAAMWDLRSRAAQVRTCSFRNG